jgi:hypothetical protein
MAHVNRLTVLVTVGGVLGGLSGLLLGLVGTPLWQSMIVCFVLGVATGAGCSVAKRNR